jgi:hypothetical protein
LSFSASLNIPAGAIILKPLISFSLLGLEIFYSIDGFGGEGAVEVLGIQEP